MTRIDKMSKMGSQQGRVSFVLTHGVLPNLPSRLYWKMTALSNYDYVRVPTSCHVCVDFSASLHSPGAPIYRSQELSLGW